MCVGGRVTEIWRPYLNTANGEQDAKNNEQQRVVTVIK